jgi:hypothetical protein
MNQTLLEPRDRTQQNPGGPGDPLLRQSIGERFRHLRRAVRMVAAGDAPSLIILGQPGLGKTFEVTQALATMGWERNADYFVIKGYSSSRALYEALYANNGRLTIFDDCDSALCDRDAVGILKGALEFDRVRPVSWLTAAKRVAGVPRTFDFDGQVIFISNLPIEKIDPAICSRSLPVDVHMTPAEILQHMETILPTMDTRATHTQRRMALDFIRKHRPRIPHLSLRTLVTVLRTIIHDPSGWEPLAYNFITQR